jgi:hypothetical protein
MVQLNTSNLIFRPFGRGLDELLSTWYGKYVDFLYIIHMDQHYAFILLVTKTISVLARTLKSGVRFWALYFPISYQMKLTNKLVIKYSILLTMFIIIIFIPQPIVRQILINSYKTSNGFLKN